MSTKTLKYASSLLILPVLYVLFSALHVWTQGQPIDQWVPRWDRLLILATVIVLERIYTYRYAVSQRYILGRDIIANIVNLYITGAVAAVIFLPIFGYLLEHFLGRKTLIASPELLGPFWLQIAVIMVSVSLFRYWMHRWQHNNEFLWKLHSYHHRVTDLTATNGEVSNPIDFALRNILIFLVLGVIGFNTMAVFLAFTVTNVTAVFSHCAADVKAGVLNYVFMTPEVHRWHHTRKVPEGYGYSCNYGVEFSFWDILFGTYYLPKENGQFVMPKHIGHPDGIPDEGNYLKILLQPIGLYGAVTWVKRMLRIPEPQEQQAAE